MPHLSEALDKVRKREYARLQRRAYGLHDEEYLKLEILTCTLPAL